MIAVDEKVSAIFVTLDGRTIKQDGELKLIEKVKGQGSTPRASLMTARTTLSMSSARMGESAPAARTIRRRFNLIRVPIDPSTGRLDPDDGSGMAPAAWIAPHNILPAMQRSPQLAKRANACLGTKPPQKKKKNGEQCEDQPAQGANIEGIAVLGDRVFVGFRGPVDGGTAYLLAFDRKSLFEKELTDGTTIPIKLGPGKGVRDLAAVADGLLVLSGPEDDEAGQAAIYHFDPKTQAITLLGTWPGYRRRPSPRRSCCCRRMRRTTRCSSCPTASPNGSPLEYKVPKP